MDQGIIVYQLQGAGIGQSQMPVDAPQPGKLQGQHRPDALAPGKQADLIVIDLQRPNMQPVHNAARNLVYSGSKENVRLTMIAGRVLYENGAFFVGEPVQDIYRAVEENFAAMRAAL